MFTMQKGVCSQWPSQSRRRIRDEGSQVNYQGLSYILNVKTDHKSDTNRAVLSDYLAERPQMRALQINCKRTPSKILPADLNFNLPRVEPSSRAVHVRSLAELQRAAAMHTHPDVVYGGMIPDPDYSDEDLDQIPQTPKINHSINNKTISSGILNNKNKSSPPLSSINSTSSSPPISTLGSSPVAVAPSSPASGNTSPAPHALTMVARNNRANTNNEDTEPVPPKAGSPQLQQKENKNSRFDENGLVLPKKLVNPSLESTEKKSLHRELLFNQKIGVSVLNQKTELQKAMEKHKGKQIAKEQEREKQANLTPFQRALEQQALKLEQGPEKNEEAKKEPEAALEFQKLQARLRSKLDAQ